MFAPTPLRENIRKNIFVLGNVQRGGGIQPESKSLEVVLLSPILTTFGTLNGEKGGVDHVPKVFRNFLKKYWEFWALYKLPH